MLYLKLHEKQYNKFFRVNNTSPDYTNVHKENNECQKF
jgi:hypothetical protein